MTYTITGEATLALGPALKSTIGFAGLVKESPSAVTQSLIEAVWRPAEQWGMVRLNYRTFCL